MKAIVYTQYGSPDVLNYQDVEQPTPQPNEVLIKVVAASVNAGDRQLMRGEPFLVRMDAGISKPKINILGAAVAGSVEAVGSDVTQFAIGDEVFGDVSGSGYGGFAEYVTSSEEACVPKPPNMTFEQAAALPVAAVTALQALRDKGNIQSGQRVLVNGASGGVGSYAVQIAKSFGAEVTAVASSRKLDVARELGADHLIDYTQQDFTRNGQQYDLIVDTAAHRSLADYRRALAPNGTYVMIGGAAGLMLKAMAFGPLVSMLGNKQIGMIMAKPSQEDLLYLSNLFGTGQVNPVIDRCFPLSDVAEALRYIESGQAQGKVIISVSS